MVADAGGRWRPAPAYDLPTSQPYGGTTLALCVGGKNGGNIGCCTYVELGREPGLPASLAARAVLETANAFDTWIAELDELPVDGGLVRKLTRVVRRRQRLRTDSL